MEPRDVSLKIGFTQKERNLLALLIGSIAGGGFQNPLHIRSADLDGKDSEIRDLLTNLYPVFQVEREM